MRPLAAPPSATLRHTLRGMIANRHLMGMLAFGALQQGIVAGSIVLLGLSAMRLAEGAVSEALGLFVAYLVALVLPYGPGVAAQYCWRLWAASSVRDFHDVGADRLPDRAIVFADRERAEAVSTIFSNSAPNAIGHGADYGYDLSQCGFATVFGIIAVAAIVDPMLAIAFAVSILLCAVYMRLFYAIAADAAHAAEARRVDTVSLARRIWPNVVLANPLSRTTWKARLAQAHGAHLAAVARESRIRFLSAAALAIAAMSPVVIAAGFLAYAHADDASYLAALLVTMPRVFFILSLLGHMMALVFEWSQVAGRFEVVRSLLIPASPRARIDLSRIEVRVDGERERIETVDRLVELCLAGPRRITIRGGNGAGKTTLLLSLKERLGTSAVYVPPDCAIDLPSQSAGGSSGERKRAEIEAVLADHDPCIVLLDEWDANLDAQNREMTCAALAAAIVRGFTVVEITHR